MKKIIAHSDYPAFLAQLKQRILHARTSAARTVNRELVLLYWDIGRGIVEKQQIAGWGDSVVERLGADLRDEFPDMRGFSIVNLRRMKQLYLVHTSPEFIAQAAREMKVENADPAKLSQAVRELAASIPWGHHANLLAKLTDPAAPKAVEALKHDADRRKNIPQRSDSDQSKLPAKDQFLVYLAEDGRTRLEVRLENETVWLTQAHIAKLFQTTIPNISMHLRNVLVEGELQADSVIKEFLITAADGKNYATKHYNLDAIISVGYRVKSAVATRFRIWATQQLREYIVKGFVLDDERLKNPDHPFDYFDELLRRIQDIRTSERRFNQRITDIYATSIDYDPTQKFHLHSASVGPLRGHAGLV